MSSSSVSLGRNLVSLKWEEFNIFVVSELAALYQKDDLTDVTLFCEGRSFRAHKVLLSLWSTYFRDVFRGTNHSHPVVILKETSSSDLELILRFIYQGHLLIPIEETDRFLKTAEHFQVAGLKNMRNHVPSFYSGAGSSGAPGSFHEDAAHQQQQPQQSGIYEGANTSGSSLITLASPHSIHSHQQGHGNHFRTSGSLPQPSSTISLGGVTPTPTHPPHSSTSSLDSHHTSPESSNQQQVIRQSRPKHSAPTTSTPATYSSSPSTIGFQSGAAVPSSVANNGVGVVTRLASESVIYQPQPVLIFQNGPPPPGAPIAIKSGESPQYIARSAVGGDGRSEHSMMVIEGVVGDAQVHIEPSTSTSHNTGGTSYTVYTHPSLTPPPNPPQSNNTHHSSDVPGNSNEEILGLPSYHPTSSSPSQSYHHPREVITVEESSISSQNHHHHHHIQHISHDSEMETSTVVVSHPYTPSTASSYEPSPLQNGSNSNSTISSVNSSLSQTSSPSITKTKLTPDPPPVYAVKRIPPPLPPSPPPQRNFKSTSAIKTISSKGKSPQGHHNQPSTATTRSKSIGGNAGGSIKITTPNRTTQAINPSPSNIKVEPGSTKSYPQPSSSSGTSTGRKVVLVPCPKCGKKVKQTSLKVHMKRTHLEEGTVLVCPICSKRISSKGVYYKHMYIHRKRSETESSKPSTATIKGETQGT